MARDEGPTTTPIGKTHVPAASDAHHSPNARRTELIFVMCFPTCLQIFQTSAPGLPTPRSARSVVRSLTSVTMTSRAGNVKAISSLL